MIGQVVSHYRILSELGAGGMGVVYLANDTVLKRRVAIKMLNAKHFSRRNEPHLRLLREARAISQINHPNIATIYDFGETADGQPFIVMEYVDGEPLSKLIERRALTISGTVEIIGAVAAALSEAHRRGIIHRDIKPSNIVLSHRDEVKVLDFGLAKQIENETLSPDASTDLQSGFGAKTREGAVVGTPLYLSPEQATGGPIDERSDIFSLGSVLYECLTGQPPFYAQSSIEICARILRDYPPPPSKINPAVTAGLDRVISKALAKDVSQRYQSAREFRQDLGFSDLKRTADEGSPSANVRTDDTRDRVDTDAAAETETKRQRDGSTAAESRRFTLSFGGLQNIWSGTGSFARTIFLSAVFLITCAVGYVGYRAVTKAPIKDITQAMQFQRVPISGNVKEAIISPDGKYVVAVIDEAGKQAIQLTELATSSNIRIAGLSEKGYRGLAFSPDNNYVYYLEDEIETATLYRVSKLGGNNRRLLENVNTVVTFSPDGSRMSFVRYDLKEQSTLLMIANEDGTNEQRLALRKPPEYYTLDGVGGPAWSPNGGVIACPLTIDRPPQPSQMYVEAITVRDGSHQRLNKEGWYQLGKLSWLSDGGGLIVAGANALLNPSQLSILSYPDGKVTRITNDPNEYSTISSAVDSSLVLTVKTELLSTVWVMPSKSTDKATALTNSQNKGVMGIAWLSENTLIHVASGTDGLNIWREDIADGKNNQLTSGGGANYQPDISPDKHYIVFVSNRSGSFNIWRMNSDGTNQVQLTKGEIEDSPRITPDGKWVVYHRSQKEGNIWKVSIDGGEPLPVVTEDALYPALSPDGKMLACFVWDKDINSRVWLGLVSLETGTMVRKFSVPPTVRMSSNKLRWSRDELGLVFVNDVDGVSNLWVQPLDGANPGPLTYFRESQIFDFAWSPNGQQLACVRGTRSSQVVLIKGISVH